MLVFPSIEVTIPMLCYKRPGFAGWGYERLSERGSKDFDTFYDKSATGAKSHPCSSCASLALPVPTLPVPDEILRVPFR